MDWICLMNSSPILALSWNSVIQPFNLTPKTFPLGNNVSFFSIRRYSPKLVLRTMKVHFPDGLRNVSSAYQTNLTETRGVFFLFFSTVLLKTHCGSWLYWWLLPATAINDVSDKIPSLCFSIYKPQDVLTNSSLLIAFSISPYLKRKAWIMQEHISGKMIQASKTRLCPLNITDDSWEVFRWAKILLGLKIWGFKWRLLCSRNTWATWS